MLLFFTIECFRKRKERFNNRLLELILYRYAIPHFSFMFLTLVILHKFKDIHDPLQYLDFESKNLIGSCGTLVFVIFKLFEPQTVVWWKQIRGKKISKEEWKKYEQQGLQLDVVLAQSFFIEALYLTLKCIKMETKQNIQSLRA